MGAVRRHGRRSIAVLGDPFENLLQLWRHARWPLAGIGLYVAVTLWAAATSLAILANAPKEAVPPRIA